MMGPEGVTEFDIKSDKDGKYFEASGVFTNGAFHCVHVENGVTNRPEVSTSGR